MLSDWDGEKVLYSYNFNTFSHMLYIINDLHFSTFHAVFVRGFFVHVHPVLKFFTVSCYFNYCALKVAVRWYLSQSAFSCVCDYTNLRNSLISRLHLLKRDKCAAGNRKRKYKLQFKQRIKLEIGEDGGAHESWQRLEVANARTQMFLNGFRTCAGCPWRDR